MNEVTLPKSFPPYSKFDIKELMSSNNSSGFVFECL